jgi:phosphotransferase system  glucose/maltose/N-acetylglucosamine-specific IIC component
MAFVGYLVDNPIITFILAGFLILMAAIAWGQIQTGRVDRETARRSRR